MRSCRRQLCPAGAKSGPIGGLKPREALTSDLCSGSPVNTSPPLPSAFCPLPSALPYACPPAYFFSPASIRIGSRFWGGGSGQVAYGVKAQGGLYALLKSTIVFPFASG